tara:strand:- start:794 stop:1057 length:264 start_codon:yes stop_codon:yes gene_type:complete
LSNLFIIKTPYNINIVIPSAKVNDLINKLTNYLSFKIKDLVKKFVSNGNKKVNDFNGLAAGGHGPRATNGARVRHAGADFSNRETDF